MEQNNDDFSSGKSLKLLSSSLYDQMDQVYDLHARSKKKQLQHHCAKKTSLVDLSRRQRRK